MSSRVREITPAQSRMIRHLALSGSVVGVGLLIFWLSGGFPGTSWRLLFQQMSHLGTSWRLQGPAILLPFIFLCIQSLCLALAWVLLLWGGWSEGSFFYMEVATRLASKRARLALQAGPTMLSLPEPAVHSQQALAELSAPQLLPPGPVVLPAKPLPAPAPPPPSPSPSRKPQQPLPEPKVIRRLVPKQLQDEYVMGNPFAGPGQLPDVLREEARLANPFEEAEIEEIVIAPDGAKSVTRKPVSQGQESQRQQASQPEQPIQAHSSPGVVSGPVPASSPSTQASLSGSPASPVVANNPFEANTEATAPQVAPNRGMARPAREPIGLENPFEDPLEAKTAAQEPSHLLVGMTGVETLATAQAAAFNEALGELQARTVSDDEKTTQPRLKNQIPFQSAPMSEPFSEKEKERRFSYPLSGNTSLQVSSITHIGLKRLDKPNEDSHYVFTGTRLTAAGQELPVGLFLVADGMGGHNDGQYASAFVIQSVGAALEDALLDSSVDEQALRSRLLTAVETANAQLFQRNEEQGSFCGTTLTGALLFGRASTSERAGADRGMNAYIINVGDSRVYRYSASDSFTKITRDHSVVEQLIAQNLISPEERYTDSRRNQIYNCLGRDARVEVDSFTLTLASDDRLLICSDGLWETVRDTTLAAFLSSPTDEPEQVVARYLQAALEGGGEDNITAIVVFIP